jgi:hypothetical protein
MASAAEIFAEEVVCIPCETKIVEVWLSEAPTGFAKYIMTPVFDGDEIATVRFIPSENFISLNIEENMTVSAVDLYDVVRVGSGPVLLGTLDISTLKAGESVLYFEITEMTDDIGNPIEITQNGIKIQVQEKGLPATIVGLFLFEPVTPAPPCPGLPTPTPIPMPTPSKTPSIEFSTNSTVTLFQTGPVYVYPNTVVQLRVLDLEYNIDQIQWDYGDGRSSGWIPADKNKQISHTYTKSGVHRPVVEVRSLAMSLQLSSEDTDEHRVIVYDEPVTGPTVNPTPPLIVHPTPPPQNEFGYLPFPNMKGPQADLNGDGLVDDFNGDGKVNAFDVTLFLEAYMREYLSPASAYDYNQNGKLDLRDIIVFFDEWSALNALAMMFGDDE